MHACRTCLSRYDLSPLFDYHNVIKFTSDQLFLATGVKIVPNDGLPQTACRKCIKTISKTLELRELSSVVDHMFRSILKNDIEIKTEPNDSDIDNRIEIEVNTDSSVNVDPSKINNDSKPCKNRIRQKKKQKDDETIDIKEYLQFEIDGSFNTNEHTDTKPKLKRRNNYNRNKAPIIKYDDDGSNDASSLPFNQESTTKHLNDNVKHENDDKYDRDKKTLNTDNSITKPLRSTNQSATKGNIPIIQRNINIEYDYSKTNVNKLMTENWPVDDASGKMSDLKIENYLPQKDIDELFNADAIDKYCDIPKKPLQLKRPLEKLQEDRRSSIAQIVDGRDRYTKYFLYKRKPRLNGTQRRSLDRRTEELNEKYKKLMELAVKPYTQRGPVQCKVCHSKLRNVANFRTHAKTHFEPEFTCEFQNCGKKFYGRHYRDYHQQRKHGVEKRLACAHCPFRSVDRPTLRNHERAEHTGERPYVCNECGAAFRMRNNIIQHMTKHFGVRNMQCELCPSLFTRRSQLWSHQNSVHFLTYTYHCYLCPETYKGILPVRRHLVAIHGVPLDQQLKIRCVKTRKNEVNASLTMSTDKSDEHLSSR